MAAALWARQCEAQVGAMRLPHRPYREQIELLGPALSRVDRLAFDGTGVGDAVGEMLPGIAATAVVTTGNSETPRKSDDGRIMSFNPDDE